MLRSGNDVKGLAILATDGELGKVDHFLFDDDQWTIRYVVVDTGGWLLDKLVLIPPRSINRVDWEKRQLTVRLTRHRVEHAPGIDSNAPVSRQMEAELANHYGYQPYWGGTSLWGESAYPFGPELAAADVVQRLSPEQRQRMETQLQGAPQLRSTKEIMGYAIRARDGDIGQVSDVLMDDETWAIRYLVVATGSWWSDKHVLLAPLWATGVSWAEQVVEMDLTRSQVKSGPTFEQLRLSRDDEQHLHQHYRRPGYWEGVLF